MATNLVSYTQYTTICESFHWYAPCCFNVLAWYISFYTFASIIFLYFTLKSIQWQIEIDQWDFLIQNWKKNWKPRIVLQSLSYFNRIMNKQIYTANLYQIEITYFCCCCLSIDFLFTFGDTKKWWHQEN